MADRDGDVGEHRKIATAVHVGVHVVPPSGGHHCWFPRLFGLLCRISLVMFLRMLTMMLWCLVLVLVLVVRLRVSGWHAVHHGLLVLVSVVSVHVLAGLSLIDLLSRHTSRVSTRNHVAVPAVVMVVAMVTSHTDLFTLVRYVAPIGRLFPLTPWFLRPAKL